MVIAVAVAIMYFAPQLTPAFLTAALGSAAAVAVTTAVLTMAATLAMNKIGLTPMPGVPGSRGGTPSMFRQSISESFIVYGKRRVGGLLVFFHPRKVGKDHYRYFVIAVAGHHCQGVVDWMLNDEVVTVNGSNMVTSGPYASAAWLWFQLGDAAETANATFVSECGGKWSSAHKGNDTAAIYAKFKMTDAVVEAGMPNVTAVIEGKDDILDPRDATEKYTRNATLVIYDWMKLAREEGGFGAYADEIPDDDWISAQANVCDEDVSIPGATTEKRYALDGLIITGAPPAQIREAMVLNCAGSHTFSEGKFLIRPGYFVPPTATLEEADLAGPIVVDAFVSGDQTANRVEGTYVNPDGNYQGAPFTAQALPGAVDIRQMDIDLGFVTSPYRAERIASIMLLRAAAEKTVQWPMNIVGLGTAALQTVQLATSRYGLSNYAWQVQAWNLTADFNVALSLREENEDIYGEPTFTAPAAVDTIDVAQPLIQDSDASVLVNTSSAIGITIQGAEDEIVIGDHFRRYTDLGDIAVDGDTITVDANSDPIAPGTEYLISYDDIDRAGGAVTYLAFLAADSEDAFTSSANPYRHYVGSVVTAEIGEDPVEGVGSLPPGVGGWNGSVDLIYDGQVPLP